MPKTEKHTDESQGLPADIKEYVEKRVQLFTLTLYEKISLILAHSFQQVLGVLFIGGGILFAWFALSYFVGRLVGDTGLGFLISSVPLFIAGFILFNHGFKGITERIQAELMGNIIQNLDLEEKIKKDGEESGKAE